MGLPGPGPQGRQQKLTWAGPFIPESPEEGAPIEKGENPNGGVRSANAPGIAIAPADGMPSSGIRGPASGASTVWQGSWIDEPKTGWDTTTKKVIYAHISLEFAVIRVITI
jgi:hypothetical protein